MEAQGRHQQDGVEDVFEINDFTCASPWESFVADIEAALRLWGLADSGGDRRSNSASPTASGTPVHPCEAVVWCGDRQFLLAHHRRDTHRDVPVHRTAGGWCLSVCIRSC
eukprot:Opistho-2@20029